MSDEDDDDKQDRYTFIHPIELLVSLVWNTTDFRLQIALENVVRFLDEAEEDTELFAEDIYEVIASSLSIGQNTLEKNSDVKKPDRRQYTDDEIEEQVAEWSRRLNGKKEEGETDGDKGV